MAARKPAAKMIREDAGERLLVEAAQKDPASSANCTTFILKGFTHSSQAEDKLGKELTNGKCSEASNFIRCV